MVIKNFLVGKDIQYLEEHWLGIFKDNLYDSLFETLATMEASTAKAASLKKSPSILSSPSGSSGSDIEKMSTSGSSTLIVAKSIRQSLHNWSGYEDVMKVGLEMAKNVCRTQRFRGEVHALQSDGDGPPSLRQLIQFKVMVYVPGLLWEADEYLDYIITDGISLEGLYRDLLKIIHLCGTFRGSCQRHSLDENTTNRLSNVLCRSVKSLSSDFSFFLILVNLLCRFRQITSDA